jgi:hypothetical protein
MMECPYCKVRVFDTHSELYGHFARGCRVKSKKYSSQTAILEFRQLFLWFLP